MTREELIAELAEACNVTKGMARKFLDALADIASIELGMPNAEIPLGAKLGRLVVKQVPERKVRSVTGEEVLVPAHLKVVFKPSRYLKEEVLKKKREK